MRLLPALLLFAIRACAADCSNPLTFYDNHGYHITDIQVRATLGFIKTATTGIDPAKLRLHKRKVDSSGTVVDPGLFRIHDLSLDNKTIKDELAGTGGRLNLAIAVPAVENCDDAQLSLTVVYQVFLLNIPVEQNGQGDTVSMIVRSLIPATGLQGALKSIFPKMVVGYDASHHLFGGMNSVVKSAPGGLFDTVSIAALGSSSSSSVATSFSGSRDYAASAIQHLEWAAGYTRSDEPTAALQVKQSKEFARIGASTAPSASGVIWYFGTAVEGGNEQTNLAQTNIEAVHTDGSPRSPYGAIKTYAALSARPGGNPLSISYGLQLGKASPGASLDYTKHLLDASYSSEWFPQKDRHKAISLEARFAAGFSTGVLPLAERFLGGNRENYFIDGDSWRILDQPLIRSFPANRFTLPGAGIYGGDSFQSANATLAYPLFYHRPLVPDEILQDPDFADILNGALVNQTKVLENHYLPLAPEFVAFRKQVLDLAGPLHDLRQLLTALATAGVPADSMSDAISDFGDIDTAFAQMQDPNLPDPSAPLVTVAVGFPKQSVDALLVTLADDLDSVIAAIPPAMAAQLADLQKRQAALRSAVNDPVSGFAVRYPKIDTSPAAKKAANDMKVPTSVLHRFLNELNLLSISPAILFDAARLQSHLIPENPGWRYAFGPAIRFTLVNVNFTFGYSFNISPRKGDPTGAFAIGMSFGDLFR
jgi:hypothetical protein